MVRHDLPLPPDAGPTAIAELVEQSCLDDGFTLTLLSTLAAFPGCTHWHWKRGRERGTLEVTLWPQGRRLWVSVHASRVRDWTEEAAARLAASLTIAVGTTFA